MIEKGYECTGCTMRLFDYTGINLPEKNTCCGLADVQDAQEVAKSLGMEFRVLNYMDAFRRDVMDKFVREYQRGRTPNPCIDCNRYMKFGLLWEWAKENGYDVIVTGHYSRVGYDAEQGRWYLEKAVDPAKDQSYVLYGMTQEQLAHTMFPVGEVQDKEQVRRIAEAHGFVNSKKPDSQDICFVPEGTYADFIERQTGQVPEHGRFVDEEGRVLGEHKGLVRYTIGQRKGLGLALEHPMYVKDKDLEKNEVILTSSDGLFSDTLIAEDFNWIWTPDWKATAPDGAGAPKAGTPKAGALTADVSEADAPKADALTACVSKADAPKAGAPKADAPKAGSQLEVMAKPRYRAPEAAATARVLEDGRVEIRFHEPQRALTTGQAVVLYAGNRVVGGGTIAEVP